MVASMRSVRWRPAGVIEHTFSGCQSSLYCRISSELLRLNTALNMSEPAVAR